MSAWNIGGNNGGRQKSPPLSPFTALLTGLAVIYGIYLYRKGQLGENDLIYFAVLIPLSQASPMDRFWESAV